MAATKIAFVFPGQGSQYVGMGKELSRNYKVAKDIFDKADQTLGFSLSTLCFEGPKEELQITFNTQPALLATSIAILSVLNEFGLKPDVVAGHSLGEYTAVVAAGALTFEDALLIVRKRGLYMEEAVPAGQGTMAAVLGLSAQVVEEICKEVESFGLVEAVNYNTAEQIVVAGEKKAVEAFSEVAKKRGAKRVIPLAVSGPFHSKLMAPAANRLKEVLIAAEFKDATIPIVVNYSAQKAAKAEEIRQALIQQVDHPVLWRQSVELMHKEGAKVWVEVGPGKALSGMIKKIIPGATVYNAEDENTLQQVLASFRGEI